MSILSKICVVLLLVLTLVGSTVFTKMAVVDSNYRDKYDSAMQQASVESTRADSLKVQLTNAVSDYNQAVQRAKLAEAKLAKVEADLTSKLASEGIKNAGFVDRLTQLSTAYDLLEKKFEANNIERNVLRNEKNELQAKLVETDDAARSFKSKLDEEIAQKERLEKLAKFRSEQIMDLQNENEELKSKIREGVAAVGTSDFISAPAVFEAPDLKVTGTVTAVAEGIASINIGSARGIQKGMQLKIYRDGHFVAHLRIDMVDTNQAAGVIFNKKLDVVQGDKVTSSLR